MSNPNEFNPLLDDDNPLLEEEDGDELTVGAVEEGLPPTEWGVEGQTETPNSSLWESALEEEMSAGFEEEFSLPNLEDLPVLQVEVEEPVVKQVDDPWAEIINEFDPDSYVEDTHSEEYVDAWGSTFEEEMGVEDPDEEDEFSGVDLDAILAHAIDVGASDVHVSAGSKVGYTILGDIEKVNQWGEIPLDVPQRIQQAIVSNVLDEVFVNTLELDTAYVIRNTKHRGRRTRLSVGKSFGQVFLVFRVIADVIPTPEELEIGGDLLEWADLPNGLVLVCGPTGSGKSLHHSEKLPTPRGFKLVGELEVGDQLFDEMGKPTTIIKKHLGLPKKAFKLTFSNGQQVFAGDNHLWEVEETIGDTTVVKVVETSYLVNEGLFLGGRPKFSLRGLESPVQFAPMGPLPMHPYLLGAWLGLGDIHSGDLHHLPHSIEEKLVALGVSGGKTVRRTAVGKQFRAWRNSLSPEDLRAVGALTPNNVKAIPESYLCGSAEDRKELLSGLMDSSGMMGRDGTATFVHEEEAIVEAVGGLVASLGWQRGPVRASVRRGPWGGAYQGAFGVSFTPQAQLFNGDKRAKVLTEALRLGEKQKSKVAFVSAEEIVGHSPQDYICFEVDSPNHLFLFGESYLPTHNSTTFASIIRKIQLEQPKKIITLEKPVEYIFGTDGKAFITQREIGRDGRTFSQSLTSAMRQAPDVIMVGEVRNQEEISELIRAAETGHLALSTIHSSSPPATLNRISSMFEGEDKLRVLASLQDNLRGLCNQVLVKSPDGTRRTAVREVLTVNDEVGALVGQGDSSGLREYQIKHEITMDHELIKAVKMRKCSLAEARSKSAYPAFFDELAKEEGLR